MPISPNPDYDFADPRPSALMESLRSVGYSLPAALADIVDNSIAAGAQNIWVDFRWDGGRSTVSVLDDGRGMAETQLVEAMRPGAINPREERHAEDLGRFGLGLKTASFSQCRHLSVWSREKDGAIHGRCWDLDYVAKHNEWRLRKNIAPPDLPQFEHLARLCSGTLVLWQQLDRVVDERTSPSDSEAQRTFLDLVKDVRDHLAMVFHRYLSGTASTATEPLVIFINGITQGARLGAWNPFEGGSNARPQTFPTDEILYQGRTVTVHGFVMPHKDRLTAEERIRIGGPKGWLAQQGFYIYRNDRILVAGDWLRLGRGRSWPKEEHYKLARLSIDIPNSMDLDWALDVKKSNARPPIALRGRLSAVAEAVRQEARRVFAHRGHYGVRSPLPTAVMERPWEAKVRADRIIYRINRKHPLVADVLQRLGPLTATVERLLRLVEETVPVERIWLDKADGEKDHAIPYEGLDTSIVTDDIRETYRFLRRGKQNDELCRAFLMATPPFDRYPNLIERVIEEG
jgi:Histidine kinase-, DNA gyrase B-, and HSP90-like ATPase